MHPSARIRATKSALGVWLNTEIHPYHEYLAFSGPSIPPKGNCFEKAWLQNPTNYYTCKGPKAQKNSLVRPSQNTVAREHMRTLFQDHYNHPKMKNKWRQIKGQETAFQDSSRQSKPWKKEVFKDHNPQLRTGHWGEAMLQRPSTNKACVA